MATSRPSSSLLQLKRAIAALSESDLDDISQYVRNLRGIGGARVEPTTTESTWEEEALYKALSLALTKALGGKAAIPYVAFRKIPSYKLFAPSAATAIAQHYHWLPKADKLNTISMLRLYAGLIVAYLQTDTHIVGWRSICWALDNLPVVVDYHFPNYAQAGQLQLVASLRTKT